MEHDNLIACHECDTLFRKPPLVGRMVARSPRCGATLYRGVSRKLDSICAMTLAALITFVIAQAFPIVELEANGITGLPTDPRVQGALNSQSVNGFSQFGRQGSNPQFQNPFVVNPKIDCIIWQDVEITSSCEYADIVYPANTWMEFQTYEVTASCSNPFLYVWKGGIPAVFDTRDDVHILA